MTSGTCEQKQGDERIYGKPIQFDLGAVHVEPEVAQHLAKHGVAVEYLLAMHERLIPSAVMDSMDNFINISEVPKKGEIISVYPVGTRGIKIVSSLGCTQTKVMFEPTIDELLQLYRPTSPLKNLLLRIFR